MICPACNSAEVQSFGKRHALYPLGMFLLLSMLIAPVHQLSAAFDYRCRACGAAFTRRTTLGRIARVVFWVLLGGYLLLLALLTLLFALVILIWLLKGLPE